MEFAVVAIRGAITVPTDSTEEISAAVRELLAEILLRNGVTAGDVISVIFTATPDLTSMFPAAAAREVGFGAVPLICAAEIPVPGAMERCVRVLMHVNGPRDPLSIRHVYLREAVSLRVDIAQ
jgi:chorismate mutase